MAIRLKGINTLTNKLNKLSNVKARQAVNEVAKAVEKGLQDEAGNFSTRANLIGEVDTREYSNGNYYIDVGLKNDSQPFENWKNMYYHHYGYNQKLWGEDSDIYTKTHQFWFNKAIDNMETEVLQELKNKIREEIRKAMK